MGQFKKYFSRLCACSALLIVLAWPAHEAFAHHDAGENCRVCSIACSPELNADCGSSLLARPENFVIHTELLPGLPSKTQLAAAFLGRAPPSNPS
jgi:hypothetical protein